jgi:hypothetical protein
MKIEALRPGTVIRNGMTAPPTMAPATTKASPQGRKWLSRDAKSLARDSHHPRAANEIAPSILNVQRTSKAVYYLNPFEPDSFTSELPINGLDFE